MTDMLTAAEERELGRRIQAGDETAVNELVEGTLRFAAFLARRFRSDDVDVDDLIQEANVGLLMAAPRWDPDRGVRFTTYAGWYMEAEIIRFLAKHRKATSGIRSLDVPLPGPQRNLTNQTLHDRLPDPGWREPFRAAEARAVIEPLTECLNARQRRVLRERYGEQRTTYEVGDGMGLSHSRANQVEHDALDRMRRAAMGIAQPSAG